MSLAIWSAPRCSHCCESEISGVASPSPSPHLACVHAQAMRMIIESQKHLDASATVVLRMLDHLDVNGDGTITLHEFMV